MNWKQLSKAEQLKFYKQCKELYYTTGTSPIEDYEFDELQASLGYENKDTSPTKHNPKYTVKHPVKMGSLSKVQIKKSKDGTIDWESYKEQVLKYVAKNKNKPTLIITPKFDGCSFEVEIRDHKIVGISGRGDGEYGGDYTDVLKHIILDVTEGICTDNALLRGEVLVDKDVFIKKYSVLANPDNGYVNPRSWVAGLLGRDYDAKDVEYLKMLNDISVVIYDLKLPKNGGGWQDIDWTFLKNIVDKKYLPEFYFEDEHIESGEDLESIYNKFNDYRINKSRFALDGIVIKPIDVIRKYNENDYRPKDCVAVKFMPQLQETEVIDISWKLGEKSKNLVPTIITNPVEMDGKQISRAAASNYGKLVYDKISIGTKLVLSLAGDIIPFIYKITDTSNFSEDRLNIPTNYETYVEEGGKRSDGTPTLNLKAVLTEEDHKHLNFIASTKVLNIPNLGGALTEEIWNYISSQPNIDETDEFFGTTSIQKQLPDNILYCDKMDVVYGIGGKNGDKIGKAFEKIVKNITLTEIIQSCNFNKCGSKVAEQCANYLTSSEHDFTHLAKEGYEWVFDINSSNYKKVLNIISHLGKTFDDFKSKMSEEERAYIEEQIPVILTGEPNDYASKGEFLKCHPEYRMTGKWTEVKIVFTNSLDSNTGKMKKAREKGIEIKLY